SEAASGNTNTRRRLASVTRRQASTGPTPASNTSTIASGVVSFWKYGGPTLARLPVNASEITGKNVPQKITSVSATSTTLLSRKNASRDSSESSRALLRRSSRRLRISTTEPTSTAAMKPRNGLPRVEAPNAWIESSAPERTRNVPSSDSTNVPHTSD